MRLLCLLAVSTALATPALAQVYQWRDTDGRVHYSDVPPPTGEVKAVAPASRGGNAPATDATAEPPKAKTMAEKELEFRQRRAAAAEAQAKAEEEKSRAAERAAACEQARGQLVALRSGQRLARFNSKGEREIMDDASRAAETEQAEKYVEKHCR